MTSSLVGSEMCIRDSLLPSSHVLRLPVVEKGEVESPGTRCPMVLVRGKSCLLYTSDAADDM
eukprot:11536717-Prorocentrum_lima.AAC.1